MEEMKGERSGGRAKGRSDSKVRKANKRGER